ncbi:MAG: gluconokinase [Gemmatimonadaceae bacterium]
MVIVLFGVSGAGKTTVGTQLARELAWEFLDGDDYHPPENRKKMREGVALTDQDRWPWLAVIRDSIGRALAAKRSAVVACSSLSRAHRDYLRQPGVTFVYLRGAPEVIRPRLERRKEHFFEPGLLASQFEALEEPDDGVVVDIDQPVEGIVAEVLARLHLPRAPA